MDDYERLIQRLREAALREDPAPAGMESYLRKVREGAYRITDGDVEEMREAGISEDVIFEQTVSAAVSEGLFRLDSALEILE